ncbi:hypothetical protein HZH68_014539 [Vespula germanica]|uniref:Uncharacterized protein n=1 Tax=Vespula germanica TaxID=30212 RepID=A0A834J997_VESGE|nr:hypothetical protein HZH68_014539 [Vespula germanica]
MHNAMLRLGSFKRATKPCTECNELDRKRWTSSSSSSSSSSCPDSHGPRSRSPVYRALDTNQATKQPSNQPIEPRASLPMRLRERPCSLANNLVASLQREHGFSYSLIIPHVSMLGLPLAFSNTS